MGKTIYLLIDDINGQGVKPVIQNIEYWKEAGYKYTAFSSLEAVTLTRDPMLRLKDHCSYVGFYPEGSDVPEQKDVSQGQTAEEYWNKVIYIQHLESGDEASQQERQQEREKAIQECVPLIEKCEKTFDKINEIFKALQEAQPADLYLLVREIDVDIPLIQAKIKDELENLKQKI